MQRLTTRQTAWRGTPGLESTHHLDPRACTSCIPLKRSAGMKVGLLQACGALQLASTVRGWRREPRTPNPKSLVVNRGLTAIETQTVGFL